mmetsp:Transcript_25645/g.63193  ORF Transcript_25645/g.63193 Transcript_25645/m.63193 type:complete len:295 (+) Transcript_25645:402-1286(+)
MSLQLPLLFGHYCQALTTLFRCVCTATKSSCCVPFSQARAPFQHVWVAGREHFAFAHPSAKHTHKWNCHTIDIHTQQHSPKKIGEPVQCCCQAAVSKNGPILGEGSRNQLSASSSASLPPKTGSFLAKNAVTMDSRFFGLSSCSFFDGTNFLSTGCVVCMTAIGVSAVVKPKACKAGWVLAGSANANFRVSECFLARGRTQSWTDSCRCFGMNTNTLVLWSLNRAATTRDCRSRSTAFPKIWSSIQSIWKAAPLMVLGRSYQIRSCPASLTMYLLLSFLSLGTNKVSNSTGSGM